MSSLLARIGARILPPWLRRQAPGYRVNWPMTSYQLGYGAPHRHLEITYSAVYAAIDRISSDVGRLPLRHWRKLPNGGREEVENSQPLSVWRKPNELQTECDILKQIVLHQLWRGNSYTLCRLNGRNQVVRMNVLSPDACWPYVVPDTGDVFYRVARDPFADIQIDEMVPARFILHHRMTTLTNPLIGVSPIMAAWASVNQGQQIQAHGAAFFANMARPSGYLTTANKLDRQKAAEIAERWRTNYGGAENAGKTPVLEMGLEYKNVTMTATDAQMIEQLRWTIEDVARVFKIPAFLMGDPQKQMQAAVETLMRIYYSSCLAEHLEFLGARINVFFELDPDVEYLEFDADALFKTDLDVRTNAWKNAVQGGLATPNEGRAAAFGFNPVEGGDQVFMQQQMIPITMLGHVSLPGGAPPPGGAPAPGDGETPAPAPEQAPADQPAEAAYSEAVTAALADEIKRRSMRWAA